MQIFILLSAVLVFASAPGQAFAEENFSIRSGLWQMTTTSTNTMMPEPIVTTNEVCVEGNEFNPEDMVQDMDSCEVLTESVQANRLRYGMQCQVEGGEATIEGEYTVNGDEGQGSMSMNMKMGPIVMDVNVDWQSVYLGPCE